MSELDIHRLREILPHRYPFLLLDRVLDYEVDKQLKALKNVTVNEPCFQGHFPHHPVYPGVLILESIAQASAVLASLGLETRAGTDTVYLFAGIDKARFKRQVGPGDQMLITVQMQRRMRDIWICAGRVETDGRLCCSAEVMFTYRNLK